MSRFAFVAAIAALVWAADDPWTKVKELKTGAEIRIVRKGVPRPMLATFAGLSEESVVIVEKNEQKAVPREEIERLDARPPQKGSRLVRETRSTSNDAPTADPYRPTPNRSAPGPSSSSSSGLSIVSKPDFETIYRRPPAPPKRAVDSVK
jgi:hypothetical protein